MFTIEEVIKKTGLTDRAIRNRIANNSIYSIKRGGMRYIPDEEIAKLPKPRMKRAVSFQDEDTSVTSIPIAILASDLEKVVPGSTRASVTPDPAPALACSITTFQYGQIAAQIVDAAMKQLPALIEAGLVSA